MDFTKQFEGKCRQLGNNTSVLKENNQANKIFLSKTRGVIQVLDQVLLAVTEYMAKKIDSYIEEREDILNKAEEELGSLI